jgi:predicted nucleotidyltransferase
MNRLWQVMLGRTGQIWLNMPISNRINEVTAKLSRLQHRLREEFQVRELHVFGSVARGESGPSSDLDLLVEFEGQPTFARFMELKFLLEDELGFRIDLVTKDALRPALKEQILQEAKRVA